MKVNKTIFKVLSFFLIFTFLIGTMSVPVEASTTLSQSVKNAYINTLNLRKDWEDIEEICSNSVDCEDVFSEYYEALEAFDEDSDNAYYGSVYTIPTKKSKQKTTSKLGTPVDFLEYNIVGFLDNDDERDAVVYKCKGTLWLRKISGRYIITKVKRAVTLLDDYTEDISNEDTVDMITKQIDTFIEDESYYDDDKDDLSDVVKVTVTRCPATSYVDNATISGKSSSDGYDYAAVSINGDNVEVNRYDGTWSKKVTLKEGDNTFEIVATNNKGKTASVTKKITFYSEGPTLIIEQCPQTSSLNTATISGSVSDKNDKTPKIYINGDLLNIDYYGHWSMKVNLKEGENSFEIKATNSAGKSTIVNKKIIFNTEGPTILFTNCPETSTSNKVTISGRVTDTNDKSPKLYINDNLVSVNSYRGEWSKEVTLKEGENAFTIKATNSLGKSTSITKTIIFNTGAPDVTITNCPETSTLNKVTISGRVSDANDKSPKVYINDNLISVNSYYGEWSKEVILKEGDNTFIIKATNNLNKATTITKTITFNIGTPDLIITNCPETSTIGKVTITGKVTDTNDKTPKVYINDDLVSVSSYYGEWSKEVNLKEGDNTFTIKATNSLGKITTITKIINFGIEAPSIIITNCVDSSTVNKVTISGKVSDTNDKAPKIYIKGDLLSINWDGSWSKTVTLIDGVNTFEIKATNSYGKSTTITKTITYGFTPPTLQVLNCPETSGVDKIVISGTVSDISDKNPLVYINDESASIAGGAWSKELTLRAGQNSITIKATNTAGKSTTVTKTIIYTPAPTPTPTPTPTSAPTPTPTPAPTSTPTPAPTSTPTPETTPPTTPIQ